MLRASPVCTRSWLASDFNTRPRVPGVNGSDSAPDGDRFYSFAAVGRLCTDFPFWLSASPHELMTTLNLSPIQAQAEPVRGSLFCD